MASTLCSGIGLDTVEINNKFLLLSEENHSDSSVLIGSLVWKALLRSDDKVNTNVCLLSLHNTQDHYENIALKLGFNLGSYVRKGNIAFVDGFKYVHEYLKNHKGDQLNASVSNEFCKTLFLLLKDKVDSLSDDSRNNVYLFIDDVSDLLMAGITLPSVLTFIKYCRGLLINKGITLVVGTYITEDDNTLCVLYRSLYCVADYIVMISGLKTGFSAYVSGSIKVIKRTISESGCNNSQRNHYHFKFNDRLVKVFSPGTIQ